MYEPGIRFIGKRNPNYWKKNAAWADSYEQITLLDPSTRVNAILTDAVDYIDRADFKVVDRLRSNTNLQIIENVGTLYFSSAMDSRVAPFNDNNVRHALKYAVDRQEFVDKINLGYGTVGNDHPVPPNDPYFNTELAQRPYDPDKARYHLRQAGLDDLKVAFHASEAAYNGAVDAGLLFRESAAEAGIDLNVVREPNDGYWSDVWPSKSFVALHWMPAATPTTQFEIAYALGTPWADGFLCHDRFEELLKLAKAEFEFDKRREILWEMQQIQSDEGSNHVFLLETSINVASRNVGGAGSDAYSVNQENRVADRLWLSNSLLMQSQFWDKRVRIPDRVVKPHEEAV